MNVYFDNSATTNPFPEVTQSMKEVLDKYYGNPSSLHYLGVQAEQLLTRSRQVISQALEVNEEEIIFTSGGTESINMALKGVSFQYKQRGKHIITSEIEHAAVYHTCQSLEKDFGYDVTYLPVDSNGVVSLADLKQVLREDTILVSIMHVNNELGSIQPIAEIGAYLKNFPKVLFHVDAVQGIGKVPLSIKDSFIDLLSLSGHKFHAPKGTGILYIRSGVKLYPLFHGGEQQFGIRPGTENVPAYVALAKACRMVKENEQKHIAYLSRLQQTLLVGLEKIDDVHINTPLNEDVTAPHIVNVSFTGLKPEVIVHALEEKGIYVSTKSACSSKSNKSSRILTALGLEPKYADSAIRISFSAQNTLEEVRYFLQVVEEIIPHYTNLMKV